MATDVKRRLLGVSDAALAGGTLVATDGARHTRGFVARGERDRVRRWAEQAGLDLMRRYLTGLSLPETSLPET